MNREMCTAIENYVFNYLKENTRSELIYHDYTHTSEVAKNAAKIGKAEKLTVMNKSLLFFLHGFTIPDIPFSAKSTRSSAAKLHVNIYQN